jgi:hypothetical protein
MCAKEIITVLAGVCDLHFKTRLLAISSPATMDVQVKQSHFSFFCLGT